MWYLHIFCIFHFHLPENSVKKVFHEPVKPKEHIKKGEAKKSFFANSGTALQSTPLPKQLSSRTVDVGTLIYEDEDDDDDELPLNICEEIEYTKPVNKYGKYSIRIVNKILNRIILHWVASRSSCWESECWSLKIKQSNRQTISYI